MWSAYATAHQEGPEEVQPEAGQAPPDGGPAEPTTAQELQQLQAQQQNLQQERDRIAAAYAASLEAALAAAQASKTRQQLSVLQAEILSMQPPPQVTVQPAVLPSAGPAVTVQLVNYSGSLRSTLDLRWPTTCKPITLPKFNGKTVPRQFLMSFEAAVASAGGNETVMAKSFVIAAEGDALAWYSMLRPGSIYSWRTSETRFWRTSKDLLLNR